MMAGLSGAAERTTASSAYPDWERLLNGRRHHVSAVVAAESALKSERCVSKGKFQHLEALACPCSALVACDSEPRELLAAVSRCNTEIEPPVRDDVDDRRIFCQPHRIVEWHQKDLSSDANSPCARRYRRRYRH
jgi:hypothetical protein